MRPWCHALLALLFAASMTDGQTQSPASEASSEEPQSFAFTEGHAYMGSDRVIWEQGRLVLIRRVADLKEHGGFRETSEKLDPPKQAWNRFWTQVDTAGVWQWQASYSSERSSLPDGSSWGLEVRHANRHVKSQGYNAVPPTYSEFRKAVYQLLDDGRRK